MPRIAKEPKARRVARQVGLPAMQIANDQFDVVDVQNHSDDDQRRMTRSGERKTIRRKDKLETLYQAGMIDLDGYKACVWYRNAYSLGFDTIGITSRYGESNGSGATSFTHFAKHLEQQRARDEYATARNAIDPLLIALMERVVIHARPMGRLALSFRLSVRQLVAHAIETGAL